MRRIQIFAESMLAGACLLCNLQAQTGTGTVRGSVLTLKEQAVAGAKVSAVLDVDDSEYTAISELSGQFSLNALPAGHYRLHVFAERDGKAEGDFTVTAGSTLKLHITVSPSSRP